MEDADGKGNRTPASGIYGTYRHNAYTMGAVRLDMGSPWALPYKFEANDKTARIAVNVIDFADLNIGQRI